MPRHATSTSWKKGDKPAEGNDKTAKLSTFLEIALKGANTREEYDDARTKAHAIAADFVDSYWEAKTVQDKKAVISELMDRTEGKPAQSFDLTSQGEKISNVSDDILNARIAELEARIAQTSGEEA